MKGLLTSLITVLAFGSIHAQSPTNRPRLIVGLCVDQLRSDHLEAFASLYGERGLKRLWKEALVYPRMHYPYASPDRASALASIYSGTTPSLHGIVGERWMNTATLKPVTATEDAGYMGYYTDENHAPSQLLVSTLADELKEAGGNEAIVYSIAPHSDAAIFGAGHRGDGAFWLNTYTGKWSGTTYYGEFPLWASQYNDRKAVDTRIDRLSWEPLLPVSTYSAVGVEKAPSFKHSFNADRQRYRRLQTSPLVNEEVNALAGEALMKSKLGQDNQTDLLALTYYVGRFNTSPDTGDSPLETADRYVRLDRCVAQLLDEIDRHVGLQHVLFFLVSTGYSDEPASTTAPGKSGTGSFYMNRCTALLNMFLMATYGEGKYVETFHGREIYLNHKLIEQKQLDRAAVEAKCVEFLMQFSGVNEAYSAHRLLNGAWNPQTAPIRNGFHRKNSGDLIVEILPGWSLAHEDGTQDAPTRYAPAATPFFLMGRDIKPQVVVLPASIESIAPTVSSHARIRAPNGCSVAPLCPADR